MDPVEPQERRFRGGEVELAWFEWRPELAGRAPTYFFAHATGFHARVFDRLIAHLGECHVVSVDQRGHGRSGKAPIESWKQFGDDLAPLIEDLGLSGAVGVGHSMGGHALTQVAAGCPGAFERLLLADPVIASPDAYAGSPADGGSEESAWSADGLRGQEHPVTRRKRHFRSPEEMFERFQDRRPYSLFEPEALRDYCRWGLLPDPDGEGWVLACDPATEASVYMTARSNGEIHAAIRVVDVPVVVVRARSAELRNGIMDFETSPTWPGLAGAFRRGTDVQLPELSHFMPMQAPALLAEYALGREP